MEEGQSVQRLLDGGLGHHRAGRLDEAEVMYRQILEIDSEHADCLNLLGVVATQGGRLEEGAALIRRAIAAHAGGVSYYVNLGNIVQAQGELDEAVELYRHALRLRPELLEALVNLANVLMARGDLEESEACYGRALGLNPESAEAHYNLGNVLELKGDMDGALAEFETALRLRPDYAQAAFGRAMGLLTQGKFEAGWKEYEWRWLSIDHVTPWRTYREPAWVGERMEVGSVLIWREQGIGDEVMFAGMIADAVRTGTRCILECDARLQPIFERSFPEVTVVTESGEDLDVVAQLPSGSLPGLFRRTEVEFCAGGEAYLMADGARRDAMRARYSDGRPVVGLAWYTANRKSGRLRSVDLGVLARLFEGTDVRWVSLQYGDFDGLEEQARGLPICVDREVDQLVDLDGFAAQVAAMDLVITIDNSTAHLAGALGVPVWVMLPAVADWRWMEGREDSPWYGSMRLFRQAATGDWGGVVERVREELIVRKW